MDPDSKKKRRIIEKEKNILKNINSEDLLSNIWQVSSNSIIVALMNLVFHFVMSRTLGPAQYGELETLLTINSIILITLSAVAFIVARFVSYYRTRQQYDKMKFLANWSFIFFFIIGCAGFIINLIISRLAANFLNMTDYTTLVIFGLMIWISFLMPIIEGILRGLLEFRFIGKYKITDAALRLVIGSTLVFLGLQVKIIIVGLVIGASLTLLLSGYMLKKIYVNKPYKIELKDIYKFTVPVFLTTISFAILSNIDLVLVKHFFDAQSTGYFAAAAMLAKVVLGIAFGSAGVMFPKIVEDYSNGNTKSIIKTLRNTLKIFIIAGFILTLILAIYPTSISRAFFGNQYDIGSMLSIYAFATFFLSLTCILMMYDLAVKRFKFIIVFIAAAFLVIYQISVLHNNLFNIVWALFTIDLLLLAFMIIYNKKALFSRYY